MDFSSPTESVENIKKCHGDVDEYNEGEERVCNGEEVSESCQGLRLYLRSEDEVLHGYFGVLYSYFNYLPFFINFLYSFLSLTL